MGKSSSSRRTFLTHGAALASLSACTGPAAMDKDGNFTSDPPGTTAPPGTTTPPGTTPPFTEDPPCVDPFAGGEFLGVVDFTGEPDNDYGVPYGVGWDGRLLFDLQRIELEDKVTPNELFYIRTNSPDLLTTSEADWTIKIRGLVGEQLDIPLADVKALQTDQGEVMLECSGNTDSGNFGLMSAARWSGVPLLDVLDQFVDIDPAATRVLVRGFDDQSVPSEGGHSTPGAAWVFTFDELAQYGAFLAFGMNGVELPDDHGFPVRLMVPRWFGCACIKWVNKIVMVDEDEPATGQMMEFASRTHQIGEPLMARDYRSANMEQAAMPVRVEKWRIDGQIAYRILGILWGGDGPTDRMMIAFDGDEAPVDVCPTNNTDTWSLFVHRYDPVQTGEVLVTMRVDDPGVPQIRLDQGWYDRTFEVDEV